MRINIRLQSLSKIDDLEWKVSVPIPGKYQSYRDRHNSHQILPVVYKYNSDIPYSKKNQYMQDASFLNELHKGVSFVVVPDQNVFSIYQIHKGNKPVFLLSCNKHDLDLIKSRSIMGVMANYNDHDIRERLKEDIFYKLENLYREGNRAFYKLDPTMGYNRSLIKSNNKLFTVVRGISSGSTTKDIREKVLLGSVTLPTRDFEDLIDDTKSSINRYHSYVDKYKQSYIPYSKVYRWSGSSKSEV